MDSEIVEKKKRSWVEDLGQASVLDSGFQRKEIEFSKTVNIGVSLLLIHRFLIDIFMLKKKKRKKVGQILYSSIAH